jgi:MFS family permease
VGVVGVLGPDLASSIGLDPNDLVVIVAPLGLGVVGGVFGLRFLGDRVSRRRAAETGLVAFGLLAGAIASLGRLDSVLPIPAVPLAVVLAFLAGSVYAATTVSAQTALFENMPAGVRGRVFGVLASIVSATSLLPILVAGPLADATSGPLVIALTGVAVVAVGAWSATFFGPVRERVPAT